jgi:hypothetical protein
MKLAPLGLTLLSVVCLTVGSARADEPRRLLLDPPGLLLGSTGSTNPAAPQSPDDSGLTQAQINWIAFGADALLQLGTTAVETGLIGFGTLSSGNDSGLGTVSILVVGLMLAIHPALDAFLVDAIARVSHQKESSFLATLGGAYLGCLLGAGGFALALVTLEAVPVLELVVASLLNALIPAATTVLANMLSQHDVPLPPRAAAGGSTVAQSDPPSGANQAAWKTGLSDPLARWSF